MLLRTCLLLSLLASVVVADDQTEFFEARIRPVLVEHCYRCHSQDAEKVRGGLLLDSKKGMLTGGDSGPSLVAGDPGESLIISALKHESFEMPPDRRLPKKVIQDFEKWISEGAADPRSGGKTVARRVIDLEEGRKFWSFRPLEPVPVPLAGDAWGQTDIDRFLAAKFAPLEPAKDASSTEMVRRLYFTLTGLPPTTTQISRFATQWKSNPQVAVRELADELLESPRFGERWGRHWLDVSRFAESSGGGRSLMFPHAWRFRDYVIQSFNEDVPIDQLIREHIAGDLLPAETSEQHNRNVTGVGYLTLGPTNYEQQDKELLRMEVIDEQIDTIGRTFLGMTLGCARCHDHKFDPVPTADYYALAGIFRSTKTLTPGNVSGYVMAGLKGSDGSAEASWKEEGERLKAEVAGLRQQLGKTGSVKGVASSRLQGVVVDNVEAQVTGKWTASTSVPAYVDHGYIHDEGEKGNRRVVFRTKLPAGEYQVRMAYSHGANRPKKVPVRIVHADGTAVSRVDQTTPGALDGLFDVLGEWEFSAEQPAEVQVIPADASAGVTIVDAIQFVNVRDLVRKDSDEDRRPIRSLTNRLKTLEQALKAHQKKKPTAKLAMAVQEDNSPGDWHIHIRGGIRNLGEKVPRGVLQVALPPTDSGTYDPLEIPDGVSGRLELADWIASEKNPLTARVFVNRVWYYMMGEGLVRTPDNFGATGSRPTHPELLDHLAWQFVTEDDWSVKRLIRRIALSRAFRLSSTVNPADPDNLKLSFAFRRRLEAEAIRDAVLQVSGELDLEAVGGRTIAKLSQYDNGYDHDTHSEKLRSVYVPFFRNSMLEFLTVFDVANPNLVTGKRAVSTLPSQSLFLLNSPFMLKQAENAARHFLEDRKSRIPGADGRIPVMIREATGMTLGRAPTVEELRVLAGFVSQESPNDVQQWTSVFHALFASVDFRYLD